MKPKAVFIDRDGTINVEKQYLCKFEEFELIPGALEALRMLTEEGIYIYIITNQSGIARGFYTEDDFHALTASMLGMFVDNGIAVEDVLYCPHHPTEGAIPEYSIVCNCRKPKTGMLDKVIADKGYKSEELCLIGDKAVDVDAGRSLGITTYMVETGYGNEEKKNADADYMAKDILEAVKLIIKQADG